VCILGNQPCSCISRSQVSMVEHLHIKQLVICIFLILCIANYRWNMVNTPLRGISPTASPRPPCIRLATSS
jgi:hypothetical protein